MAVIKKSKRLYDSARWRKIRKFVLNEEPLCAMCLKMGRETAATTVDHIQPHKNEYALFWDINNLQSLCYSCHNATKQMIDVHGYSQAAGIDGQPLDKQHPWNKA